MNFYNPWNFISPAYTVVMLYITHSPKFSCKLSLHILILENFYQKKGGGVFLKNSGVQEIARIDSFVNKNYTVCTCCARFQVYTFYNTHSNSNNFKVEQRAFCKCRVFFLWTLKWRNLYVKFWWNNLRPSGGSYKIIMVMWELA